MAIKRYIGTDVGSEQLVTAYPKGSGGFEERRFANDEAGVSALLSTLRADTDHVVVEATGTYSMRLVWALCQAEVPVSVLTPAQSDGFVSQVLGETVKNDSRDARNLSLYGQKMQPQPYGPPSEAVQKAAQLQSLYSQLVVEKGAIRNRLHALSFHPLANDKVVSVNQDLLGVYEQKIEEIKAEMLDLDQDHFDQMLAHITSIKGVGQITATAIIVATNGLKTFSSPNQLTKFVGVCPTEKQSGKSVRGRGSIPRKGNRRLRSLLYNCAKSAKRYNPICKELYERLRSVGKCHKVAMVAVMRKLLRLIFAVVKNQTNFELNYQPAVVKT